MTLFFYLYSKIRNRTAIEFYYDQLNLKLKIDIDRNHNFTLDVHDTRFESLPYRACPIHLSNEGDEEEINIHGVININGHNFLGEWGREDQGQNH